MTIELKVLVEKLTTGDSPHLALRRAHEDGSLARLIPELEALYGVPQNAVYHPEVDTGKHLEMVLQVAASLTASPRVRFAALVHDFGKGLTPAHEWPKHLAHEEKGVPVVEQFCLRAGVPDDWRVLGVATSKWHLFPHRAFDSRPGTLVKLFVESNFINEPELFEDFLMACEADKRGRGGLLDSEYPQRPLLQAAMKAVKEAKAKGSSLPPEAALLQAQCEAVKGVLLQLR
jgi:tRNA nucleotidyltransferase (CCA-adding enzyme)